MAQALLLPPGAIPLLPPWDLWPLGSARERSGLGNMWVNYRPEGAPVGTAMFNTFVAGWEEAGLSHLCHMGASDEVFINKRPADGG